MAGTIKGEKPKGEPDKGIAAKTTPELPVEGHSSKANFALETSDPQRVDLLDMGGHPIEPAKQGKPGKVTYRFADGSTVTNDVADTSNPPAVAHDDHGAGVVVEE